MVNEVFSDTGANINPFVKAVRLLAALLVILLFFPVPGEAQSRITPCNLAVKTNFAYDALGAPSLGMEIEVGKRWSVAATAAYNDSGHLIELLDKENGSCRMAGTACRSLCGALSL